MKNVQLCYLIANTPVHPGGSEQISIIDLPIQRERHTQFPKIEASSLKGALRIAFKEEVITRNKNSDTENKLLEQIERLFGGESTQIDKAASLGFTDARILLFPVKSVKGVFVWITCPTVLSRFMRESNDEKIQLIIENILKDLPLNKVEGLVSDDELIIDETETIILEEFTFKAKKTVHVQELANYLAEVLFP